MLPSFLDKLPVNTTARTLVPSACRIASVTVLPIRSTTTVESDAEDVPPGFSGRSTNGTLLGDALVIANAPQQWVLTSLELV